MNNKRSWIEKRLWTEKFPKQKKPWTNLCRTEKEGAQKNAMNTFAKNKKIVKKKKLWTEKYRERNRKKVVTRKYVVNGKISNLNNF
jgi:hypothetical protein